MTRIPGTTFSDDDGYRVDPENFLATLHANVNNAKLTDKAFRQLVLNTLPIVRYTRPLCERERIHGKFCGCTCIHTTHPVKNHAHGCPEKKTETTL